MGTHPRGSRVSLPRMDLGTAFDIALADPAQGIAGIKMAPIWRTKAVTKGRFSTLDYSTLAETSGSDYRPEKGPAEKLDQWDRFVTWSTEPRSFRMTHDIKTLDRNPNKRGVEENTTKGITMQLLYKHEERVLTLADSAISGTGYTASPGVKWNNGSNTTIRSDVWTRLRQVRKATYGRGRCNAVAMWEDVLEELTLAPELVNLVSGAQKLPDQVTQMDIIEWWKKFFKLDHFFVADSPNWTDTVYFFRTSGEEMVDPQTYDGSMCTPMADNELDIWELDLSKHEREYGVEWEEDEITIHPESICSLSNVLA